MGEVRVEVPGLEHKGAFLAMVEELTRYNRSHHDSSVQYDDFEQVLEAVKKQADRFFHEPSDACRVFLAFHQQRPVGYVLARIYEEPPEADNGGGRMGLLDQIYVRESSRGLGVGQRLMAAAMDWFAAQTIQRVKLHSYSWNRGAQSLYEKMGFRPYAVSYETFLSSSEKKPASEEEKL